MPNLVITNRYELLAQGSTIRGLENPSGAGNPPGFAVSVTGLADRQEGQLATASVLTLWSSAVGRPSAWSYLHYVADQDTYLQLIGSATNVILKVMANVPLVLSEQLVLAAANTTAITGGAQPVLTSIASIVMGNYSGSTTNFTFMVVS